MSTAKPRKRGHVSRVPTSILINAAKKRLVFLNTAEIAKKAGTSQQSVYQALYGGPSIGEETRGKVFKVLGMRVP